jgi:hypothetical protein
MEVKGQKQNLLDGIRILDFADEQASFVPNFWRIWGQT